MTEIDNHQRPLVTIGGQEVQREAHRAPQQPPAGGNIIVAFEPASTEARGQSLPTGVPEADVRPAAVSLLTLAVAVVLLLVLLRRRPRTARCG